MIRSNKPNAKKIIILIVLNVLYIEPLAAMEDKKGLIHVLIWSGDRFIKAFLMQKALSHQNCRFQNCFITDNTSYFKDIRSFDAILFDVKELYHPDTRAITHVPQRRARKQQYIFFSMESAEKFPITDAFKDFFNLTWTYRVDSDVIFPFIEIRDMDGNVVGPKEHVEWLNYNFMKYVKPNVKTKLQNKNIAAALIASNCVTNNKRMEFVHKLNYELKKYGHSVDIFGLCGRRNCSRKKVDKCFNIIQRDYYFYLAFESTFDKDFVTTKIMYAWKYLTIPVVYGGADYTRFLPAGSYLNARELGPKRLASEMNDLISDKESYYEFFKWHRYYSIHSTGENWHLRQICEFCTLLNHIHQGNVTTRHYNLVDWWNTLDKPPYYPPIPETKPSERNVIKEILSQLYDKYFGNS